MTIELTKDLEQFVHDAVRAGLYAREDEVIRDALTRLRQAMPNASNPSAQAGKATKPAAQPVADQRAAEASVIRRMMEAGLVTQLPDTAADFDDPEDQPIAIQGEPLSETVIRDRR